MIIKKLNALLSKHDKKYLIVLLIFSIFVSIVETVGVSVIMPFITLASDFGRIHSNIYSQSLYDFFHFKNEQSFIVFFGIVLIIFYILRSGINIYYSYHLAKFARGRYHILAYRLFENYVSMPYRKFIDRNSSNLTKTIVTEAQNLTELISSIMFMMSEIFIIVLIYSILLFVNWKITMLLTILLGINALLITQTISKWIENLGNKRATFQQEYFEVINSTLGNFKMLKLRGEEKRVLKRFESASWGFARANIMFQTFSVIPRLFLEAIGFSIVIGIVVYLIYKYNTDVAGTMGLIAMFVLGLYRMLPSVNRILNAYNQIKFRKESLHIVHSDIFYEIEDMGDDDITFVKEIKLQNIYFHYKEGKDILKDINLTIRKGDKIAFTGESGSGKSTLIDIIIGLYRSSKGQLFIDETPLDLNNIKSWRRKIGYIPQQIYLFDGTVAENICMGEEFDKDKMTKVLKQANIWEFLNTNHEGYDTFVGEGGVKLSGGQRQRIAIARALYTDPEVLVLDEATSALDNETEAKIMDEIYSISSDKTLIIVAHRLSTLAGCQEIYHLEHGKIVSIERK